MTDGSVGKTGHDSQGIDLEKQLLGKRAMVMYHVRTNHTSWYSHYFRYNLIHHIDLIGNLYRIQVSSREAIIESYDTRQLLCSRHINIESFLLGGFDRMYPGHKSTLKITNVFSVDEQRYIQAWWSIVPQSPQRIAE